MLVTRSPVRTFQIVMAKGYQWADMSLINESNLATRNVAEPATLATTLSWALQPADSRPAIARQYVIALSLLGGEPLPDAHLSLREGAAVETASAPLRAGTARLRVVPGRYRATVTTEAGDIELAGLVLGSPDETLQLELMGGPPMSLGIDPERPPAGGTAFILPLATPSDNAWVAVAAPQAPVADAYAARQNPEGKPVDFGPDVVRCTSDLQCEGERPFCDPT